MVALILGNPTYPDIPLHMVYKTLLKGPLCDFTYPLMYTAKPASYLCVRPQATLLRGLRFWFIGLRIKGFGFRDWPGWIETCINAAYSKKRA